MSQSDMCFLIWSDAIQYMVMIWIHQSASEHHFCQPYSHMMFRLHGILLRKRKGCRYHSLPTKSLISYYYYFNIYIYNLIYKSMSSECKIGYLFIYVVIKLSTLEWNSSFQSPKISILNSKHLDGQGQAVSMHIRIII